MDSSREIYLDNAATSRPDPTVINAMVRALQTHYGNPSSLHRLGIAAEHVVTAARAAIARSLEVAPEEIVFTSGGTEANSLALRGAMRLARGRHLLTTMVEHSSVLESVRTLRTEGYEVTELPVDREGRVNPTQVSAAIRPDTALVSVMAVNNELGTIQPIEGIARALRHRNPQTHRVLLHVDGVQAWGKVPLRPRDFGIDLLSVSAHKVHGPKGVGALYVRKGIRLAPLFAGGDQERGIRPGTENVVGIAGIGAAAELLMHDWDEVASRMQALKMRLANHLVQLAEVQINSPLQGAAPHILNASFAGIRGETLLHRLEEEGVFVSTGSACHSHAPTPSHVLLAIGLSPEQATSSLRFSLSRLTTTEEIDAAAAALRTAVPELRALVR